MHFVGVQRVEVYQSTHYPWLPYVTKESLAARVQSLEEQLSLTRQALQQASDSASIHQASIQRTGSAAEHKHAHVSNDVTEALSTVSASLHVQDVVRQGLSDRNSTSGLEGMPPGSTVFVTFVNGDEKYREMMLNWALHLRAVQVWHVVVAFDDKAAATCAEQDIPFIRCSSTYMIFRCVVFPQSTWKSLDTQAFGTPMDILTQHTLFLTCRAEVKLGLNLELCRYVHIMWIS